MLTNFRREPIRSRKLLDSAKGQPCELRLPGFCQGGTEATVSCHVRDDSYGLGVKADDYSTFHGCSACNIAYDTGAWLGKISVEDMLRMVLRALQRTWRNRVERGFIRIDEDKPRPLAQRPTPPRKPKSERARVAQGRPLRGRSDWPKGRKIENRRDS